MVEKSASTAGLVDLIENAATVAPGVDFSNVKLAASATMDDVAAALGAAILR